MLMLAEMLTFLLLLSCSLIGGYYALISNRQKTSWLKKLGKILWTLLLVLLVVLFSAAHEGGAGMVTFGLGVLAIYRGITMLNWGTQRLKNSPDALRNAVPWRLLLAAFILIPSALFCLGMTVAFQSSFVGTGRYQEEWRLERFKEFVAYQLAHAQLAEQTSGRIKFHQPSAQEPYLRKFENAFSEERNFRLQLEVDDRNGRFTVTLPALLPFFPYNHLTSAPTYYGDESGNIRMIRVQNKEQYCSADAPIVLRLSPEDIEEKKEEILYARRREEERKK